MSFIDEGLRATFFSWEAKSAILLKSITYFLPWADGNNAFHVMKKSFAILMLIFSSFIGALFGRIIGKIREIKRPSAVEKS